MKIRLISDVHHEFYEDKDLYANKGEDVLVIAGDLNVGFDACSESLLKFDTPDLIYVPGNHEYYKTSTHEFDHKMQRFCALEHIHYLNPGWVCIGGVNFIGAALWTNFRDDRIAQLSAAGRISDFSIISGHTTESAKRLYNLHLAYIKHMYAQVCGPKVIVTHFLPATECISPQYRGTNLLNNYFANDLGEYISTLENTTWLFGHTHDLVDVTINTTQLVANPYGYNHNPNYTERFINVPSN
jgi:predicted phosphodiesterase